MRTWIEESGLNPTTWEELEHAAASYLTANRGTWKPATCNRKLAALRAFGKYSGQRGFLAIYRGPTGDRPMAHPLPGLEEDVIKMANAAASVELQALVALCGLCGLRVGEAIQVVPRDIDFSGRKLTVRGKGDKTRVVPVPDQAFLLINPAVAKAFELGTTLVNRSDAAAREAITRIGERAGVSRSVSSHDLRATFATVVWDKKKDLLVLKRLMGHANAATTEGYIGTAWADMVAAVG